MNKEPQWLIWAKRLHALSQTGLAYTRDPYDKERFLEIRRIAAEIMASASSTKIDDVLKILSDEDGYATPKIDVRGVIFRNDKILLVRENADNAWTLPGGWADVNETPRENVVKEVREESGLKVRAEKLLAVYDRSNHGHVPLFPFHVYKMFFLCTIEGGTLTPGAETSDVGFFGETELPPLSISRVVPSQIARMFEHNRNPEWATDFD